MLTYTSGGKLKHVLAWGAVNAIAPTRARAAGRVQARLRGRLGQVPHELLEDVRHALRRLRRAGARVEGDGLQGARRLVLGAPGLAAGAPELRRDARRPRRRSGSCGSRTGRATLPVLTIVDRLGLAPVGSPLRHVHLRGEPGLRLPVDLVGQPARHVRPQHLRRHVQLGVRRRLEAREQLPDPHAAPASSVTASTRTARTRPARATQYRATVEGPGVTPDVMWQGDSPGAYDKALDLEANDAITALGDTPVPRELKAASIRLGSAPCRNAVPISARSSAAGRRGCRSSSPRSTGAATG